MRLPEDIDAERSLIATLGAAGTLDPGSANADAHRAVLTIKPEHLVHNAHKAILAAIQDLYARCEPIDSLTLKATLEMQGTLARVGGYVGLVETMDAEEVGRPSRLVDRLLDLWRQRQIIRVGVEAARRAQDSTEPVQDVISSLAATLSALSTGHTGPAIRSAGLILDRVASGQPFRDSTHAAKLAHLGVGPIDDVLECSPGHVLTIGARPGVGKSALAIQMLWKTAEKGERPLLVSLEMDEDEVDARLASWRSGEGYRFWRDGHWTPGGAAHLQRSADTLDLIHSWCAPSNQPWASVEAAIRDSVRLHGTTVVVLDHALLIQKPALGKGANDAACWSALSRSLKRLAQELRICMVVLLQLNRGGAEGEPKLSDLKESGAWEEDANAVLLLWHKDPNAMEEFQEVRALWVKAAKNRSGSSGWKKEIEFRGATNRFAHVERTTDCCAPAPSPHRSLEDLL